MVVWREGVVCGECGEREWCVMNVGGRNGIVCVGRRE